MSSPSNHFPQHGKNAFFFGTMDSSTIATEVFFFLADEFAFFVAMCLFFRESKKNDIVKGGDFEVVFLCFLKEKNVQNVKKKDLQRCKKRRIEKQSSSMVRQIP